MGGLGQNEVTACLVTRGDIDMRPILDSLIFDRVIVWDNSARPEDMKCAGRYGATLEAETPVVYYQDDDVIVPRETQEALLEEYEPGVMTAVYGHGSNADGYDDLPLVCGGALVDRDLPWQALNRYLEHYPSDDGFLYEADFVAGVLYPFFKQVRLPFEILMDVAQHPSRLCNQPWQRELKLKVTNQARAVRDARSPRARDLAALDAVVLSRAKSVVAMEDIHRGNWSADVVGMRHDVDDNPESLETAVKLAHWEAERGYRSTYFVLHDSSYWQDESRLVSALDEIDASGHEIGIHANAIAEALRRGSDPDKILMDAISHLRSYGYPVHGVAPHGDELCRDAAFVNDEMFTECARPEMGAPDRVLTFGGRRLQLAPRPLVDFGLLYETYRLRRGRYLSDSGGAWNVPLEEAATGLGQLHILMHPDWWAGAF